MGWIVFIVAVIVAVLGIVFLNRFYQKATRDVALVRTGFGGRRVAMDGGFLSLPVVHSVAQVNMKTMCLEIERKGERAAITEDRLRVDVGLEVFVRVEASEEGVATAAQALGAKAFRPEELKALVEGKVVDALQAIAARYSMDSLHENRGRYVQEIADMVRQSTVSNGLAVESVSLTSFDQTPFTALDENNAFNAVGMRRLAEVVATNRKQRAEIESDAEVAVRASQLEAVKRRLLLDQEEREAEINQRNVIDSSEARSGAEVAERRAEADRRAEQARIAREQDVRMTAIAREQEVRVTEIARDRELRLLDIESGLSAELRQRDNAIELAGKQADEARALAAAEKARAEQVLAREETETTKARAAAGRTREMARIRAEEQTEVDAERTRSEVETIIERARAESQAQDLRSASRKAEMLAESEGKGAIIAAENSQSEALMQMKLVQQKVDRLPAIVEQMVKPAEKIDSIRIHQVSGLGTTASAGTPGAAAEGRPLVNQAVDGVLGMALQLPALRRIGEEIGLNVSAGLDGIAEALEPNSNDATSSGAGGHEPHAAPTTDKQNDN